MLQEEEPGYHLRILTSIVALSIASCVTQENDTPSLGLDFFM